MTRKDFKKLWFTDERIFMETVQGVIKSMPLDWFPRLLNATQSDRENYSLSPLGIHWESIDEDLSFEGFFTYNPIKVNQQRNSIQEFVKAFPMINLSELAVRVGISPAIMRHYACNVKQPSFSRKKKIERTLHQLGQELMEVEL